MKKTIFSTVLLASVCAISLASAAPPAPPLPGTVTLNKDVAVNHAIIGQLLSNVQSVQRNYDAFKIALDAYSANPKDANKEILKLKAKALGAANKGLKSTFANIQSELDSAVAANLATEEVAVEKAIKKIPTPNRDPNLVNELQNRLNQRGQSN